MRRTTVFFMVGLFVACLAQADAPRVGVVTGTVLDPDGKPTPGVTVQLISDRGSESVVSDAEGKFRFAFLLPDAYTVRADLEGFQPAEGRIVVSAGGRADVVLQLSAAMGEEILITGEAPLINKFDVTGGGAVDAAELDKTVAPQRYYLNLLQYFPGVSANAIGGEGGDVEGTTAFHNVFYVDGVDASFARWGGGSVLRMPNVAVGQLQMASSRADAEFGRSTGATATMVVKSGTNDFHGDLSATFQNLAWNEQHEMFPQQDVPDDLDVRWEAAIGGPIVKDKLWFFVAGADTGLLNSRVLPDGSTYNTATVLETWVGKLDFRPSTAHSLALTVADTPASFPYLVSAGEVNAGSDFVQGGGFNTLRWSWGISDDLFLETAVAYQETYDDRVPLGQYENDPAAHPSSPAANNHISYFDTSTALFWNYIQISLPGKIDHPRSQGNAALNWFLGNHDLKLGLDYQDTGWTNETQTVPTAFGRGYNRTLPGGFTAPLLLRVYTGTASMGGTESASETWGLFVRDRLSAGDHWTFNLGLRLDDQTHTNDAGAEIFQSTDLAPRVTAVYDVRADSTLLVTAGGGRYYDWIPMDAAGYFNVVPTGRAQYDQYAWSAAQQAYIGPPRRVTTSTSIASNTIQPSYKDEFTLGFEWAFHPNWAFKVNALYKEARDPYTYAQQIVQVNGVNTIANVFENISDGTLDRTSVTFLVSRRYRDNWSMTASYTLSETEGNCYTVYHVSCQHDYGEFRALTNAAGVPLSVVNRDGYVSNHLPHELKVRGNRLFALGKQHTINVGGFARYQSGSRWQLVADRTVAAPVVPAANVSITEYLEEAGNRSLDDTYQIDLNASWQFPIAGGFSASLLLEILNATDQQEQIFVTEAGMRSGNPTTLAATGNFQSPRAYRALVTLSF